MPTVLRIGPYRFYFYSHENIEPPHIHIDRGNSSAKFWLDTAQLVRSIGFNPKELNTLYKMVIEHRLLLLEAWHGYFSKTGG
ncbi:MAG: DUF4160 domain-containing protein [Sedimentisphaerales bacterium]|nr:DUF4160 domain-containing protein [Sedimentisphaerales bacterium]